jgi:hypothetical protein
VAGWLVGGSEVVKASSVKLKLELGLSLAEKYQINKCKNINSLNKENNIKENTVCLKSTSISHKAWAIFPEVGP